MLAANSPEALYERALIGDRRTQNIAIDRDGHSYKYHDHSYAFLPSVPGRLELMDMEVYHPDDILVKVDRCAMAVSLETRVPFLDKDVVEFAWTLPMEYKRNEQEGKLVLKDVLYRYVPKEMMDRPKTGFAIPIASWFRENGRLREWAEDLLDAEKIKKQGFLNAEVVSSLWNGFIQQGIWSSKIWYILMFQEWERSLSRLE